MLIAQITDIHIGFDAGTATGSVVVGALAAAWSFSSAFAVVLVLLLSVMLVAPRSGRRPTVLP